MTEITLNDSQRLYVFSGTHHTSCLGFDVVYKQCLEMARRIKKFTLLKTGENLPEINEGEIGTHTQYEQYRKLLAIIGTRKTGTWFDYDTPSAVRNILERYRKEGGTLRLFYGDTATGRCWMEENDVVGEIGRSTGPMQIPLLIEPGANGGGGVLDRCIVRIIDADSRAELYRIKGYFLPDIEIRPADPTLTIQGYSHGCWVKDKNDVFQNHANFVSFGKAAQWTAFMCGECTEQPA